MNYQQKAENIVNQVFNRLTYTEKQPFLKQHFSQKMLGLFEHYTLDEQFELLICEIKHNIENHKNRLNSFGKKIFQISDIPTLYKRYYEALYHFEAFPFLWLGEQIDRKDEVEVAQIVCYAEIQRLKKSLAYLKQDLEVIEREKQVSHKNMRYTIDVLEATIEFKELHSEQLSNYVKDDFINIPLLPLEGIFRKQLANYLLENQLTNHKNLKNQEANALVFSHNLETSLTHYKTSKKIASHVEFEAELQGGAGLLKIGIYPWKWSWKQQQEWSPWAIWVITWLNMTNLFRHLGEWQVFATILFAIFGGMMAYFTTQKWKRQARINEKTELETAYLTQVKTPYTQFETIYDEIFNKIRRDLSLGIDFKDLSWGSGFKSDFKKRYPLPHDILKLYFKKMKEINQIDLTYLRDFKIEIPKPLCLNVMLYVLRLRLMKSLRYFVEVINCLADAKIEGTLYLKFFELNATTNGIYKSFWFTNDLIAYQARVGKATEMYQKVYTCPTLVGEAVENIASWVGEQERWVHETNLAYEIELLKKQIELYKASPAEKVPYIVEMEELIVYF